MRSSKMLLRALGVEGAVVEDVRWEDTATAPRLVVSVRPVRDERKRCSRCGRRCQGYDRGKGLRTWRAPDFGLSEVLIEANSPRVICREHGVVVARVPWARPRSGFTRAFDDLIAWLAVKTDRSTLAELLHVAWRSVDKILQRVLADERKRVDVFANLERIGIDEIAYKKGHRYLTVVVNHATGRLVWAGPGRNGETLHRFFDELGAERTARVKLVSADAASWIAGVVRERCPTATQTMDPFHVVQWATRALDQCRRDIWNELRGRGELEKARNYKRSMWVLRKNPERLSNPQKQTLAAVERENQPLYRAYLLKEAIRECFQLEPSAARAQLAMWLSWAPRSRLEPFVKLAKTVREHRERIEAAFDTGASNALAESTNTRVRLLHRVAFGFHSAEPLVALAMLKLGGLCPPLPRERYPRICQ